MGSSFRNTASPMADPGYSRQLADGLLLRWSTVADVERLVAFYGAVFRQGPDAPDNAHIVAWTQDLMGGQHPLTDPTRFALVEDTGSGAIVAGACLLSQVWEFADIVLPVGRPELVGTDPKYRNRGLIRAVFELIHARSAADGHLIQGITGIRYYYRQFGYEYALTLGGNRSLPFASIPPAVPDRPSPCGLRDATIADIPLLRQLYDRERRRWVVSTRIDEPFWRWLLAGQRAGSVENFFPQIIAAPDGSPIGYLFGGRWREDALIPLWDIAVEYGQPLSALLPTVLRTLEQQAGRVAAILDAPPAVGISFGLGGAHPAYEALGDLLPPPVRAPYAWYVRVPNLTSLLYRLGPLFDTNLEASVVGTYTGELLLDFYRGGLRLLFDDGRLHSVTPWERGPWGKPDAAFPPLIFLQLLFGHRDLDTLRNTFPDVWVREPMVPLIHALFPIGPSLVQPIQ